MLDNPFYSVANYVNILVEDFFPTQACRCETILVSVCLRVCFASVLQRAAGVNTTGVIHDFLKYTHPAPPLFPHMFSVLMCYQGLYPPYLQCAVKGKGLKRQCKCR